MIRLAITNDQAFLWEMLHAALYVPAGAVPLPKSIVQEEPTIRRYAEDFGSWPGDLGFIAEDSSGASIGAVWIRRFSAHARGFGYVDAETPELSIAVVSAHRGKGVGTALLHELMQHCAGRVSLSCDPANPAWHLYERCGFVAISERTMIAIGRATR